MNAAEIEALGWVMIYMGGTGAIMTLVWLIDVYLEGGYTAWKKRQESQSYTEATNRVDGG